MQLVVPSDAPSARSPRLPGADSRLGVAVVFLLSPDFVREQHPMEELHFVLEEAKKRAVILLPVLYNLEHRDIENISQIYIDGLWGHHSRPTQQLLDTWASDLKALLEATAIRHDRVLVRIIRT
jgi:hypothetical protein